MTKALPGPPQDGRAAQVSPAPVRTAPSIPSPVAPPPRDRLPSPSGRRDPYLLAVALFTAYATLSLCPLPAPGHPFLGPRHLRAGRTRYAHLQAPDRRPQGPGTNVLGDHFSPVPHLLAPLYRLFPSPLTLLDRPGRAVRGVRRTGHPCRRPLLGRGRGLALGIAYGLSWGVQRAVDFDFHEISFAFP